MKLKLQTDRFKYLIAVANQSLHVFLATKKRHSHKLPELIIELFFFWPADNPIHKWFCVLTEKNPREVRSKRNLKPICLKALPSMLQEEHV